MKWNFIVISDKDTLRHAKNHEVIDGSKPFECKNCGYKAKTSNDTIRHITEDHKYSCHSCDYISFSEIEIKKHVEYTRGICFYIKCKRQVGSAGK